MIQVVRTETFDIPDAAIQAIVDAYLLANPPGSASSGVYTPTLFNISNVQASTAFECTYVRVGDVVQVAGFVDIDPTSASVLTHIGVSLPVASAFTNSAGQELAGVASNTTESGHIVGDPTNDRASFYVVPTLATNNRYSFTFTYKVI